MNVEMGDFLVSLGGSVKFTMYMNKTVCFVYSNIISREKEKGIKYLNVCFESVIDIYIY